jgi:hypothetical protein
MHSNNNTAYGLLHPEAPSYTFTYIGSRIKHYCILAVAYSIAIVLGFSIGILIGKLIMTIFDFIALHNIKHGLRQT